MRAKRLAGCVLVALVAAIAPASANHGTTMTGSYTGPDLFFSSDCSSPMSTTGIVCFDVNETGLSKLHVEVADVTGIPTPAYVELVLAGPGQAGGMVCESGDVNVPPFVMVQRIVVHLEVYSSSGSGCGLPGEIHAPAAGEVTVTLS